MSCLMFMLETSEDIYIAFLPLAHVLELLSENTMMLFGVKASCAHFELAKVIAKNEIKLDVTFLP